ncbi:MAG: PorV/PorQ family protein [Bacteroidetes bacterium]|nr:PorV/PorQ family protein [Bacteroidota bacterium]
MFKIFVVCVVLQMLMLSAFSQAPKYSNEFLSVGVGSRSLAMANSTIVSVNDVTSGYWNPAGLLNLEHNLNLGLMHSEYFAGIAKYDYGAVAIKNTDSSAFGFTLIRFGVDDIPNTLDLIDAQGNIHYDRISSFSIADYAFMFSYARKSKIQGLRYGANAKIIRRIAGKFASAWGFGLDAGAQYDKAKWSFGVMARDITSTFNAWKYNTSTFEDVFNKTNNEIPKNGLEITVPKIIIGTAYHFNIYKKIDGLAEFNGDLTFDRKRNVVIKSDIVSIDPHFGVEFSYNKLVYLRAGVGNIQKVPNINGINETTFQPNIGIGIRYKRFGLDYALTDIGDQSIALYSNVFSVYYSLNKK